MVLHASELVLHAARVANLRALKRRLCSLSTVNLLWFILDAHRKLCTSRFFAAGSKVALPTEWKHHRSRVRKNVLYSMRWLLRVPDEFVSRLHTNVIHFIDKRGFSTPLFKLFFNAINLYQSLVPFRFFFNCSYRENSVTLFVQKIAAEKLETEHS